VAKGPPKRPADVHERALGLLAVRPRSRRELERRLVAAGFEPQAVRDELTRLAGVGLLDDEAFARALAEERFDRRLSGRRDVASALAAKGISPQLATTVIDELAGDEEERAVALARSRAARMTGTDPQRAYARLVGLLARRGHSYEVARHAARQALGLDLDA
jgi:regulatory protein